MNCIVANINNFVKFHLLVSLHTLLCCGTRFHTVYCSISEGWFLIVFYCCSQQIASSVTTNCVVSDDVDALGIAQLLYDVAFTCFFPFSTPCKREQWREQRGEGRATAPPC
eukprot:m.143490 g.143490  ORF g.143490 m.143490 type:complete len:111 (+) comp38393_c0_seq11:84-416(+)